MEPPPSPLPPLATLWMSFLMPSLTLSSLSSPSFQDKRRRYSMLPSQESGSSVFSHSQDEEPNPDSGDCVRSVGAPLNPRQAKDAQPSSGDSAPSPG